MYGEGVNASTGGRGLAAAVPAADPTIAIKAPATSTARPNTLPSTNPQSPGHPAKPRNHPPLKGMLIRAQYGVKDGTGRQSRLGRRPWLRAWQP
jgi:hypothetical protein